MTDPTKRKHKKRALPCEWVEQETFEIPPGHPGAKETRKDLSDTAFLLRAKKNASTTPRLPGSQ